MTFNGCNFFSRDKSCVNVLLLADLHVVIIPAWFRDCVINVYTKSI